MRGLYLPPALPADAPLTQMPGDHQCLDQQVGLEIGPNLIVFMDVFGCLSARDIRRARDKLVNALAPGAYLLFGDCLGELNRRRIQDSGASACCCAVLRIFVGFSPLTQTRPRQRRSWSGDLTDGELAACSRRERFIPCESHGGQYPLWI
jgi:hypothetical protein